MGRKKEETGESVSGILPDLNPEAVAETVGDPDAARAALDGPPAVDPAPAGGQEPPPAETTAEAPPEPKRKAGRPRGSRTRKPGEVVGEIRPDSKAALQERVRELEAKQPGNLELVRDSLEGTFGILSMLLARAFGPEAEFTAEERKQLANVWATPLAPYVSADTAIYLPWITAAGMTFAIVEPKYRAIQARKKLESGESVVETGKPPESATALPEDEFEVSPDVGFVEEPTP